MVYITGDMHGDPACLRERRLHRLKKGDIPLICGDFGYIWNGGDAEQKWLEKWGAQRFTVAFIDGVHENFDRLESYPPEDWHGGRARHITGDLWHLLRGEIYELEGKRFFCMGGGEEPEREMRRAANTWWEREMPTEQEMQTALANLAAADNRVDFILTHEPSAKAGGQLITRTRELNGVHLFLSTLEDTVTFSHWYFGALHLDKAVSRNHTAVFRQVIPVTPPMRHVRKSR